MKTIFQIQMAPDGDGGAQGGSAVAEAPAPAPSPNAAPAAAKQAEQNNLQAVRSNIAKAFSPKEKSPAEAPPSKDSTPKADTPPAAAKKPESKAPRSIFDNVAAEPKKEAAPEATPTPPAAEPAPKDKQSQFKELNERKSELERLLREREQELTKYRTVAADPSEVERLKAEYKELSDVVALHKFESHPNFRKQFVEPKNKLIADASVILRENGLEGVDLASIINKPRAERSKALSDLEAKMNSYDANELRLHVRELTKISEAESQARQQREALAQDWNKQSEVKMRQAFEEVQRGESMGTLAKPWEIPADATPEERDSMIAFNQGLQEVRSRAEKYAFAVADEKTAASVATKAANFDFIQKYAFPRMAADYMKLREVNAQLTAQLEALNAHRPGADFSGGQSGPSDKPAGQKTVQELVRETYAGKNR